MKIRDCYKKGIQLLYVLAAWIFLLTACGKEKNTETGNRLEVMGSVEEGCDFEYRHVAESENGYYFWEYLSKDHIYPRLMYRDNQSGRVVPLCNKADCNHDGEECNAYFPEINYGKDGVAKGYLQYYDGNLYAVGLSTDGYVVLYRIRADGSEWEISTKLYRTDYASTGHWKEPEILLSDGYVYVVDRKQKVMRLERISIDSGEADILFEGDSDALDSMVYRVKSYEGFVFFQAYSLNDEDFEHATGGLYLWDLRDNQCSLIKEGLFGPYSVQNGFVYYAGMEGLCCYSMQDGSTKILADQPMNVPNIILAKQYIFVFDQMGDRTLTAYDYDGTEMFRVADGVKPTRIFCGNSKIMFGECTDGEGLRKCYLDLTRPLDELQWEELKAE